MRSFGCGNIPTKADIAFYLFRKVYQSKVIVAMISQADYDAVDLSKYAAGRKIAEAGAISCGEMTLEPH